MDRRNLVIVRAGKGSLHHEWLALRADERNWDIIVSYYDTKAYEAQILSDGVKKHLAVGGKFDGIEATCTAFPEYKDYDYVWLPDDDIRTDGQTINRLFDMMVEYNLTLAQPALTVDSYFTHLGLLQVRQFILRYTNFVEVMMPCMKISLLERVLPYFPVSRSGFGLDNVWANYVKGAKSKVAVIDAIAVHHTRPVGVFLKGKLEAQGISPLDELAKILELNQKDPEGRLPRPLYHRAITADGRSIKSRAIIGWRIFKEFNSKRGKMVQTENIDSRIKRLLKWQLLYRLGLDYMPTPNERNLRSVAKT